MSKRSSPPTSWHVVCDNLTIHQSESPVRWVAQISGIEKDLGKKTAKPFKWTYHDKALTV